MPEEVAIGGRDAAIAQIVGRQYGVISAQQLRALGLSSSAVGDRLNAGRLHRIHRGVYAVGHPQLSNEGRWMAAVLACGDGAVLSHLSAGALWRILPVDKRAIPGRESSGPVHVTVEGYAGRARRAGIQLHRSGSLSPAQRTIRLGIPVTTVARTLGDLRRVLPSHGFAAAVREAEFLGLPVGDRLQADDIRSELESRFLELVRRHRLPQPEVNVRVDRFIVDFLWNASRLVVEVDGWEAHRTRSAFETDRARDTRLRVLGFEVLRFTWRQLNEDPRGVARAVRSLLSRN